MPPVDYTPTVTEVARILASKTFVDGTLVGSDNNLAVDFTDDTRPTADQVDSVIGDALTEVAPKVIDNDLTTEGVYGLAQLAVARRAAMLVYVGWFKDEADDEDDYETLRQLYLDVLADLAGAQPDTGSTTRGIYSVPMRTSNYVYPE